MKNIIPKTYNEVIRKKRCYDLTKYYIISDEILVEIYNFLSSGNDCRISATRNLIALYRGKNMEKKSEKSTIALILGFIKRMQEDHIGAYAAQTE